MDDEEFAPIVIGKLLNIGGMLQRKANKIFLPFDMNQQQFSILFEIYKGEKVNQKTMVNRMMLEKAHVSKVVKKLHKMGLIEISESAEDKRSSWLSVTKKGRETVKQCRKRFSEWNTEWVGKIKQSKRDSMIDSLETLQTLFKEITKNDM